MRPICGGGGNNTRLLRHFAGLLLWIPINRAMFTGDETSSTSELRTYADAATDTFLRAYGSHEAEQSI